jgi:hypothetical protein
VLSIVALAVMLVAVSEVIALHVVSVAILGGACAGGITGLRDAAWVRFSGFRNAYSSASAEC